MRKTEKSPVWRGADQTHVVELLVEEKEVLVAIVHLLDRGVQPRSLGLGGADDRLGRLAGGQPFGHLLHPDQDADVEPLVGQLLAARTGPETVGEVVVLDGRVALDGVVAAVVVRQQQPLGRDDFARAAAVEEDHGVLHRGLVDAVDRFGREAEAFGAHIVDAPGDEARKPHALVGRRRKQRRKSETEGQ